ncbi:AAA family ATPase [Rubinisphaera sp.]|uniref:AAA family ATPase n=1 Tax=Rubinisphaera sp. TaxID=2024857 RepID=UPI000C10B762|nr:AAA family ATPase [Rubinisphaera sp.]MBV11587.1 phosphohydrolase [Rubinisphaera sp.]HCS54001.1 phosphohydrolase [Planctomycetaceae bacterium]
MNWTQLKQISLQEITAWAETQSWCLAMTECAQDAEWHSEGDVWTHTKMVLDQLFELEEWSLLSNHEQVVLIFTALFHDVAKPLTTEVDSETGRVRSPKHAVKGEHVARKVLRELECDLATREEIARLVRYHGRPAFLLEREEPTHEVIRLSWLVNNKLLYLFALADTRGRDTDSMSRPEENLYFWKMMAQESNCYTQPFSFQNDQARFLFFQQQKPNLHYVPHEDYSCTVTLMVGLPGSGKDTWLARNRNNLPVISLDVIRYELDVDPADNQGQVAQLARERCREFLRQGTSFAFNATNTMKLTRNRWVDLFADYKAKIDMVYLEPEFDQILRQNKSRSNAVPESVIHRLAEKIEPPTWMECHKLMLCGGFEN